MAKKSKLHNSRAIKTQLNDSSFVDKERLKIPDFLEARRFEIRSFEMSQLNSKYALANRVFQCLPRSLRRRAASHNVKRIPRRLRQKALREMKNTLNGVPPKKEHLRGRRLYRLKMSKRLLKLAGKLRLMRGLPKNDVYGNKLNLRERIAKMNEEIKDLENAPKPPLNNTNGAYDHSSVNVPASRPHGNMKFFKRQKEFVWTPTHLWHTKRFHMVKRYGMQIPYSPTQKCYRKMNRQTRFGTSLFDTSYYSSLVLELTPETFDGVLLGLTKYNALPHKFKHGSKTYNDWIIIDGKKQLKGSIYANAMERKILLRVFPSAFDLVFETLRQTILELSPDNKIYDCRYSLGSIQATGPTALSTISKVLHLHNKNDELWSAWVALSHANDSKLVPVGTTFAFNVQDPRFWKRPVNVPPNETQINDTIIKVSDKNTSFASQDSIAQLLDTAGRRESYKGQMSIRQISSEFASTNDTSNSISPQKLALCSIPLLIFKSSQNAWTVVLPWFWVLPLWTKLVRVRSVLVGGLKQLHQCNFESNTPTFPVDFPWTMEGSRHNDAWGALNEDKYNRLPSSMKNKDRPDYSEASALSPFKCDWEALRDVHYLKAMAKLSEKELLEAKPTFGDFDTPDLSRVIKSYHDLEQVVRTLKTRRRVHNVPIDLSERMEDVPDVEITHISQIDHLRLPVVHVALELTGPGSIREGARIYAQNPDLKYTTLSLIGFVTSGGFNLNVGHDTGLGLVSRCGEKVYVRNIGETKSYEVGTTLLRSW